MISPYDIIKRPIITEKSMGLQDERKYVFEVMKKPIKRRLKKRWRPYSA